MTTQEPFARGRAADVFDHGPDRVLRRYRTDHDSAYEAKVMRHVAEHGYPVPEVHEADGRDMVMERLDGKTMLSDFSRRPWKIPQHSKTLAGLLHQLHAIPMVDGLAPKLGGGPQIVHLDLHPDNVMLTSRGPVVIDWSNAGHGPAAGEIADLWIIMANAKPELGRFERALVGVGRRVLVRSFIKHFDTDEVRRHLRLASAHRLRDRNMTPPERAKIERFVERLAL